MIIKKLLQATSMFIVIAAASASAPVLAQANAGKTEAKFTVDVTATIPAIDLKVERKNNAKSTTINLEWQAETEEFKEHTEELTITSGIGKINARLLSEPKLINGSGTGNGNRDRSSLGMVVSVGASQNKMRVLNTEEAVDIGFADATSILSTRNMHYSIQAAKPGKQHLTGEYKATVSILFEAQSV